MQNWKTICATALMLGLGSAAWAQTATTENNEAPVADEDAIGLSMGSPEGGTAPGQPYVKETFSAWELRCVAAPNRGEICQLYQLLKDGEGNSVAEFNMFPLPNGGQAVAGANIVTPLETLLTAQLRLSVDGGQAKRYPYSFCSQVGCFARIGLTPEEVGQFRAGASAQVTIVPAAAPNETVDLSLSLAGFTAGYNALVEIDKALVWIASSRQEKVTSNNITMSQQGDAAEEPTVPTGEVSYSCSSLRILHLLLRPPPPTTSST